MPLPLSPALPFAAEFTPAALHVDVGRATPSHSPSRPVRAESELMAAANAARGAPGPVTVDVSPLLAEAVSVSLRAARLTDGDVDPTVGGALAALGYDRDFRELSQPGTARAQVVAIRDGGLATSCTASRRWRRCGDVLHRILDPPTGLPAAPAWRTVSVTAGTCADANTAATAAIIRGTAAPAWLTSLNLPARLVTQDGTVTTIAGWPSERLTRP